MRWPQKAGQSFSMPINTKQQASTFVRRLGVRSPEDHKAGLQQAVPSRRRRGCQSCCRLQLRAAMVCCIVTGMETKVAVDLLQYYCPNRL